MTENTQNPHTPTTTEKPAKANPFDGMAQRLNETLPSTETEWRCLDPEAILGKQMLALDDLFSETLTQYYDGKGKGYRRMLGTYLPLILKIQQNCLSSARTLTAMEYMESLTNLNRRKRQSLPHAPPPISYKQKEFGHDQ